MLKNDLRTHFLNKRNSSSEADIYTASLAISNQLLTLPIWDFTYYHIFLGSTQKKELQTELIITILQGKDKEIIVPRMAKQNSLQHFLLTDNTRIALNSYGIPEPVDGITVEASKVEVVFIPLLAFDLKGNRIGYGKGYYDKFLSECKPEVVKIGLSMFKAVNEISDLNPLDIPLNYCVTPEKIYSF